MHKDCTVRFEGNLYVVPHTLVGSQVTMRVKNSLVRIFHDDRLVVTYAIPQGRGHLVQDTRFFEALIRDREMNEKKYASRMRLKGRARTVQAYAEVQVQRHSMDSYQRVAEVGL